MPEPTHDIIIHGAGPVGSALALALARKTRRPDRIALLGEFHSPDDKTAASQPDPRTLALNHGSRTFLESLNAWPTASADITTVHVSQQHRLGQTLIRNDELDVPRLGSVVAYEALLGSLHARLRHSGVDLIAHAQGQPQVTDGHVVTRLPQGHVSARVAVQSHGRQPGGLHRTYNQQAILAMAQASAPQAGRAYERFTRQGPLALLPHPAAPALYAVVWCCPPHQAQRLRTLRQPDFDAALNANFGDRLGHLQTIGPRHGFPLALHAGPVLVNPLAVAVGNAAQTLHPVAGQGLNLGLRDVAQLSMVLGWWLARPHADVRPALRNYVNTRQSDRWLTAAVTDVLPRLFTTGNPLIEHACGLALLGLDTCAPLRRQLARHLLQGHRV
ncbi:MAG TPA: monooxygenase [Burkholderiaceae bacterium]|nr:monooxygenase [Burkholderiaceae bacterium]